MPFTNIRKSRWLVRIGQAWNLQSQSFILYALFFSISAILSSVVVIQDKKIQFNNLQREIGYAFDILLDKINGAVNIPGNLGSFVSINGGITQSQLELFFETILLTEDPTWAPLALQVAPNGVVTFEAPWTGGPHIGHNLFADPNRKIEAIAAAQELTSVIAGPLQLMQGGTAIIVRHPILFDLDTASPEVWGLAIALIDWAPIAQTISEIEMNASIDIEVYIDNMSGPRMAYPEISDDISLPFETTSIPFGLGNLYYSFNLRYIPSNLAIGLILVILLSLFLLATVHRTRESRQKELLLFNSSLAWLKILETSPSAINLMNSSFIIQNTSEGWTRLTGFSRDETIGNDIVSFLVEEDQDLARASREAALTNIKSGNDEATETYTLCTKSGTKLQVTIVANLVEGGGEHATSYVSAVTDVTDLVRQKILAETLLNRNAAMIISQSSEWKVLTCSDAWINQLGYTREETVGHDLLEFMEPEDAVISKEFRETLKSHGVENRIVRNSVRFRSKTGELRYVELQSVLEGAGSDWINIITMTDVTPLMEAKEKLQKLVNEDELTGLYSRRGLKERFDDEFHNKDTGVYIFDLDHFKSVNDSYGHEAGDDLLRDIGQTIKRLTETGGCAARLGGEEFAIIRSWQGWEEAKEFGEALRLALEQTVIVYGGRHISRTASIGIAMLPVSAPLSEAMHLADHFAREAKKRGRNIVCAGEGHELRALELRGTFITAEEVQLALEAGEFYYEVQPIWNVRDQRIEGFEALIRWQRADGKVLSPLQFVNLFDHVTRAPTFAALNNSMRKDVLAKLSDFPEAYVSFNYTLDQLSYIGASEALIGVYEAAKDSTSRIIMIELSERSLSERYDLEVLQTELKVLSENGFIIALDDFGVESSNLNRLQELPIDVVKLDKTLIDNLTTSQKVNATVRGVVDIATNVNVNVISEGVETNQQVNELLECGSFSQQGFVHAKPMRPEEVMGKLFKIGSI